MKITNSKKYSNAIFSFSKKENVVEQIISDLEQVMDKFDESPSYYKHLEYHKLTLKEKREDLQEVFSDFISERTYKILLLLVKDKNLHLLKNIIKDLKKLKKEDEQILEAKVISAFSLDENQKAKIKSILQTKTEKQIIIDEILEPKIIGGIKIIVGDLVIDGSIKGKLDKLQESIKTELE